ncbi:MAG TPA: hypothetical protein VF026_07525 [Ktedonobacteraceae bacterium]
MTSRLPSLAVMREKIATMLSQSSDGSLLAREGWSTTSAIRRFIWHVIDHIWEREDRRV